MKNKLQLKKENWFLPFVLALVDCDYNLPVTTKNEWYALARYSCTNANRLKDFKKFSADLNAKGIEVKIDSKGNFQQVEKLLDLNPIRGLFI